MRQALGQELEDALGPQNDDDADIPKVLHCFVWSGCFTINFVRII